MCSIHPQVILVLFQGRQIHKSLQKVQKALKREVVSLYYPILLSLASGLFFHTLINLVILPFSHTQCTYVCYVCIRYRVQCIRIRYLPTFTIRFHDQTKGFITSKYLQSWRILTKNVINTYKCSTYKCSSTELQYRFRYVLLELDCQLRTRVSQYELQSKLDLVFLY